MGRGRAARRLDTRGHRAHPAVAGKGGGRGRPRILMAPTTIRKLQALGLTAALVLWSALPSRRHPLTQALLASALVAITKAPLGFRPPALWSGLRVGSAAACVVTVAGAARAAPPPGAPPEAQR